MSPKAYESDKMRLISDKIRVTVPDETAYDSTRNFGETHTAMNNQSYFSRRKAAAQPKPVPVAFDPGALAYEDVVSLATRLSNRGYLELAKSFLEFANSPTGLAAFNGEDSRGRKRRTDEALLTDKIAGIPYVVAATMLLKSKTLKRADVDQAVLFLVNGLEKDREMDDDPPVFTD